MKITYFAHSGGMTSEGVDDAPRRLTENQLRARYPWPHFQHVRQFTDAQYRAMIQESKPMLDLLHAFERGIDDGFFGGEFCPPEDYSSEELFIYKRGHDHGCWMYCETLEDA